MCETVLDRFRRVGLVGLLTAHPGLRAQPITGGNLRLLGEIAFDAEAPGRCRIADTFKIELSVPIGFPKELPVVRDLTGRVPRSFHTNPGDGTLCLGSPTRQRLALVGNETLIAFVDRCLIPFLYGFVHHQRYGSLPFGELNHGDLGLREDFADMFGVAEDCAHEMVRLASLKKRVANKSPCPCGSGKRLGRCHHKRVNRVRDSLGRSWFRGVLRGFAASPA